MDKKSLEKLLKVLIISIFLVNITISNASAFQTARKNKLVSNSFASSEKIGRSLTKINLDHFKLIKLKKNILNYKLEFPKQKVQWIRDQNQYLVPRVRVKITIFGKNPQFIIHYGNNTIIPHNGDEESHKDYKRFKKYKNNKDHIDNQVRTFVSEIYMNLLDPSIVKIFSGSSHIASFTIQQKTNTIYPKQKIDLSCAKYQIKVKGLENEYFSFTCKMEKIGGLLSQKPRLIITWSSLNYRLLDNSPPPYLIFLHSSHSTEILVKNSKGEIKKIIIDAKIPARIKRIKTALGLGPYNFKTRFNGVQSRYKLAPSFMLYSKIDLTPGNSFRFFDALVINKSIFNNLGGYFAYQVANIFDSRIQFIPLIGGQIVSFKFNKDTPMSTDYIFPQGFESVYQHAFGIKNFTMIYGMFFSISSKTDYTNIWFRWGTKYFWEINYIDWGNDLEHSSMYGLSIGIPFLSFF